MVLHPALRGGAPDAVDGAGTFRGAFGVLLIRGDIRASKRADAV